MEPPDLETEPLDNSRLAIRYSGEGLTAGLMDIADFAPALSAIRRTVLLSNGELNHGSADMRVYISAEVKKGSFEFVLFLIQTVSQDSMLSETVRTATEISKLLFGENGLIGLLKFIGKHDEREVTQTRLRDGSVQYNVQGDGNTIHNTVNNYFVATPDVAELFKRNDIRNGIWPAVSPVTKAGIERLDFRPPDEFSSVSSEEANAFVPTTLPGSELGDTFSTREEIVRVIKPSFDEERRWKLAVGDKVFGAIMSDFVFQGRVHRREVLFGTGDKLRVKLSTRTYKKAEAEYFVDEVLEVIPPPQQLSFDD